MPSSSTARSRPAPAGQDDRHFVTALARGLQVLSAFQGVHALLGNQELAERCGLPKSTVSRLTGTLTRLGYLIHVAELGKYRLGTATLALGSNMLSQLDVRQLARPLMHELATRCGASVSLGVREGLSMIYIEHCRSQAPLTLSMDVGGRVPLATSAIGRAWLAVIGEDERAALLAQLKDQHKPPTKAQAAGGALPWTRLKAGIERALDDHARLGVTCSFGDWQQDVNGIARALRPGGGLPPMAINFGGPASRLPREYLLKEVRPQLIELTQRLEAALPR
jgi:DNA-binding IclR family transcriptional regulator